MDFYELRKKFPYLFVNTGTDIPIYQFGVECGPGWHLVIFEALSKLRSEVKISQIKEKFGDLVIHLENGTEEDYKVIDEASKKCGTICDICGKPGKKVTLSAFYVATRCEEHESR